MPPISTSLGKYRLSSTRMAGLLPRSGWTGEVEADPLGITAFRAATRLFACERVDLGRPRLVRARSAHVSFGASEFGWYRSLLKCSPESGPGAFTDLGFSHQDGVFTPIPVHLTRSRERSELTITCQMVFHRRKTTWSTQVTSNWHLSAVPMASC